MTAKLVNRRTKTRTLENGQDVLDGKTLLEAIVILQDLQKKFEEDTDYTKIYFDIEYDYGYSGHPCLEIKGDREESNKEYNLRIEREDGEKLRQSIRDRNEYERLKGMFEGKK
mgnify:FL=1|tara:strand:- start:17171 stop:17509 length:339 start_codon:yes stop_codon:yes gene_type:complete